MHRAPHGAPDALAGFMEALDTNKHLAMDFWALVARMTDEESGKLSGSAVNGRILEVIVTVVTGQSVAEMIARGGDDKHYVGDLASMLAGEDIHRPAADRNAPPAIRPTPEVEAAGGRAAFESQFGRAHSSSSNRQAMSPPVALTKPSPAAIRQDGPVLNVSGGMADAASRNGVEGQALLAEGQALSAEVERSSLKEFPDAGVPLSQVAERTAKGQTKTTAAAGKPAGSSRRVEQRLAVQPISARVKDVGSDSNSAAGADLSMAAFERDTVGLLRGTRSKPSLEQGVLFPEDKLSARVPMEDYSERESRSVLLPMLLVLVLAGGGWGAYLLHHAGILNPFGRSPQTEQASRSRSDPGQSGTVQGDQGTAASGGDTAAQPEAPERYDDGSPAPAPAGMNADSSTPGSQTSSISKEPVKAAPIDPGFYTSTLIPTKVRKSSEEVAPIASGSGMAASGVPSAVTEPGNGRPLVIWKASPPEAAPIVRVPPPEHVPGGLIEGAKILGPDPVYPKSAKANQVSGTVVLHATITKTGSVTNLTVVSGPLDLRKSAKAAVSKWKYRPYLLDGQPTEAERTIRVDFKPGK